MSTDSVFHNTFWGICLDIYILYDINALVVAILKQFPSKLAHTFLSSPLSLNTKSWFATPWRKSLFWAFSKSQLIQNVQAHLSCPGSFALTQAQLHRQLQCLRGGWVDREPKNRQNLHVLREAPEQQEWWLIKGNTSLSGM